MSLTRQLAIVAISAIILGALAGGALTSAWVGENLGGDFADSESGKLNLGYTALTFTIWSVALAGACFLVGAAGVFMRQRLRRGRAAPASAL
jgi:hypothetical protein